MPDADPLFGRFDAAAMLAVEESNGGELSSLAQVVATFERAFNRPTDPDELSESLGLLADARLLEYSHGELGLAPKGRKFLRKAGAPWDSHRPERLADLLGGLDDGDLAPEGSLPAPSPGDIRRALGELREYAAEGTALVAGADLAPEPPSRLLPGLGGLGGLTGGLGGLGGMLPGGLRVSFGGLRNPGPPVGEEATGGAEESDEADEAE